MKLAHATRSLAIALAVGLCASTSLAQTHNGSQTSALINQQLDQRIALDLKSTPLPQVLQTIEEKTGVPVRVTDDVYDLLPWGTQTPISAAVSNLSLRDALAAMVGKLGLQMNLRDEWLELSPHPALRRIGRRSTLQELQTLDVLSHQTVALTTDATTLADLAHAIDQKLMAVPPLNNGAAKPNIVVELRPSEDVDVNKATVMVPRNSTLADALDAVASQTKMTWYPWGDSVVILSKRAVVRTMLERVISLRYDGVDIAQVLTDLANRTGVEFSIEPGAIQRVTPEFRIIKLTADAASVRQALESLQGSTGLGYVINDDGVYIWNQNSTPTNGSSGRPRPIAMIDIGNGTQALVYDDQLSKNARDALKAKRDAAVSKLEGDLTGIVGPATRPTTDEAAN